MIELLSIHIPKTAGTSFHDILVQVYGEAVSASLKRRDVLANERESPDGRLRFEHGLRVIHGHFKFREIAHLRIPGETRLICWLRHPVLRVVSNWHFFQDGLRHPQRNPEQSRQNAHRQGESLLTYAREEENRNRISDFLAGATPEDFFFIGIQEHFGEDIQRLGGMLGWPEVQVRDLNKNSRVSDPSPEEWAEISRLNSDDLVWYEQALQWRTRKINRVES